MALSVWFMLSAAYPGPGGGEPAAIASAGGEEGTLMLADGRTVRLIGIERVNPAALQSLAGVKATLHAGEAALNRYGQILAHIVLDDGAWLQEKLVREGNALTMPVYETRNGYLALLLAAEGQAREAKAGLWEHSRDIIVCASDARRAFDGYAIVQGRVLKAATVRGTTYLNFGEDYRKDFTIKISAKTRKTLSEGVHTLTKGAGADILVEVRGYVFYSGGPMIEVKTPAQISLLRENSLFREEVCS